MNQNIKKLEEVIRRKIWSAIEFIQCSDFFIHDEPLEVSTSKGTIIVPKITTLCVINALVARGTALIKGGYGGGKTTLVKILGRMLTGASLREIEESMLRANPELTEEKIFARLHLGKLVQSGEEVVLWRNFTKSFWKIVDEVNRLSPSAQDALLSLIGEGRAKYFGHTYECRNFVLFATLNPQDVGTFDLGLPFLDRFGIAIPASYPALDEYAEISEAKDKYLYEETDETIPVFLSKEDLITAWVLASRIPISEDAQLFISSLAKDISSCIRARKELGAFIEMRVYPCRDCKYNLPDSICNKTLTPISPRAIKDLVRYSKALAWLIGLEKVELGVVLSLAPYIIWHRLLYPRSVLEEFGFDAFSIASKIVELAFKNFMRRFSVLQTFERYLQGQVGEEAILAIKEATQGDVVLEEIAKLTDRMSMYEYSAYARKISELIKNKKFSELRETLSKVQLLPADIKYRLLRLIERLLKQHKKSFILPYKKLKEILSKVPSLQCIAEKIHAGVRLIREKMDNTKIVEIYICGNRDDSPCFIDLYGDVDAIANEIERSL